ncbi:MAG: transglycosylase SLT domain-containing protein [Polyangiaceae bacterium]
MAGVVAASGLAYGCISSEPPRWFGPPGPPPPAAPPSGVTPSSASAATPPLAPVEVGFDPATVVLVLDDPRLADVKAAVEREQPVRAVELLSAKLAVPESAPSPPASASPTESTPSPPASASPTESTPSTPGAPSPPIPLTDPDRAAWLFQLGKLRVSAGDPLGAAKAYEACAAIDSPLADHARYLAADILGRAGKHSRALDLSRAVTPGLGIADELELVTAAALDGTGDIEGATNTWRAYLARNPRPSNWVTVTLRFANALLSHPSEARNEEAVKLARTILDGSSGAGVGEAKDIETKALALLPVKRRTALAATTSDGLLARARRLYAASRYKEALKGTEPLIKGPLAPKTAEKQCDLALLRGGILARMKRKAEAADAYQEAATTCKATPKHPDALYNAGKWLSTTGHYAEGVKRFEELEKTYPTNRLADDARVKRAIAARDNADDATFVKLLTSLPDDFPKGDLVKDGLFELSLHHAEKHTWGAALAPLKRASDIEKERRERVYYSAGRFGYFLGRALLETGSEDKGREALVEVIQTYPLTYYMSLAYARLAERDPAAAKRALDEAMAREAAEPFYVPPHPALKGPAWSRAVELVRQGELRLARGELDLLGVGDRSAPREVLWASALLFARAGSAQQSHGVLRSASTTTSTSRTELTEWLEHYPAGKWRAAWELAFPRPFADIVGPAAAQSGIPEALAYAIMREESGFEPRVVSSAKAVGLMQLILPTAKRMAKPLQLPSDTESLKKPQVNIPLGCRYLGQLRTQFPDNVLLSIPGYNAGGGAPKRWLKERPGYDFDVWVERIPYDETQKYTKRVIGSMSAYELLYWQDRASEARSTPRIASKSAAPPAAADSPGTASPESTEDAPTEAP